MIELILENEDDLLEYVKRIPTWLSPGGREYGW